jgi:HAD superfamily hydrolase (TIGR01490 family)
MKGNESKTAAFIDLDGTLCETYLWQALFAHHKQKRFKRLALFWFIAYHYPLWLLVKAGLLSKNYFFKINATNLAWLVGDVSLERGEELWEWVLENVIGPHLRPEMLAAIREHKSKGHRIILISGSFAPLLDKLVGRLEVETAIATPLEVKDGHYTGRIISPLNIGQSKAERLNDFLDGPGKDIDLAKSYFYTDSIVDAPVLEMFGHPVVVYPDESLVVLAAERGWTVIGGENAD